MTTTRPTPPRAPNPDPHRLLHRLVTGLLALGFLGYVLHEHPELRETATAVGGLGALFLAAVLAAGRGR
ncbi:hypothetical protein [Streptomyces prasinus]|uniref:hypothetical protein n=1 Tax=Streptomyces prasinus TaxID=67345 RepID=UPI0006EBB593|nr:hypothetical protein [Streptomyces prasinus]